MTRLALRGETLYVSSQNLIEQEWRQLVLAIGVSGVQVHDARLVAIMQVYQVPCLLTFHVEDFVRYPNISPVHPKDIT